MILYNSGLENHPDGAANLNAVVNGDWNQLDDMFSPTIGLTASQATTNITASAAVFTTDDVGATVRFANGTTRVINGYTSSTIVTTASSGTVASQSFKLYRTDQTQKDALIRGLTKRVRMLAGDDGKLFMWNTASQKLVPVTVAVIDETGGTFTLADAKNIVVGSTTGTKIGTATTQKIGFWNVTPVVQPAAAGQAAVTFTNANGDIGGLTISAGYSQAEVQALRNACEVLADDCRNLLTLVLAQRTAMVNSGLMKGAA